MLFEQYFVTFIANVGPDQQLFTCHEVVQLHTQNPWCQALTAPVEVNSVVNQKLCSVYLILLYHHGLRGGETKV